MGKIARVILTGQMRSGTTFLSNLLNEQDGVKFYSDFLHIARLKNAAASNLTSHLTIEQRKRVIERFLSTNDGIGRLMRATGMDLNFQLSNSSFLTLIDFYNLIFKQITTPDLKVIGHKTTNAEESVAELLELCPDLKCLYIYRDPRDVFLSNKKVMHQDNFEILENWHIGMNAIEKIKHTSTNNRLLSFSYENLILKPEEMLHTITDFLDIDKLILPEKLSWYGKPFISNSSFKDIKSLFDAKGIGRWRNGEDWIPSLAEIINSREMRRAGYKKGDSLFRRIKTHWKFHEHLHPFLTEKLKGINSIYKKARWALSRIVHIFNNKDSSRS